MSCPAPTGTPTPSPTPTASESESASPAPTQSASPEPSDAPSSTPTDTSTTSPVVPAPSATSKPAKDEEPADAIDDPGDSVFTLPAAQLGGSSISIGGLQSVTLVTVKLANGKTTPVLRIAADSIGVDDFVLDVRAATGPKLVTTSDHMELSGHAVVYVNSISGSLDGKTITIGTDTPSPGDELPSTFLRVTLGLVGATGDQISFIPSHQALSG